MAFFGLTSLGAQSAFDSCQTTPIHVFTAEDFQNSWNKVVRNSGILYKEQLRLVIRDLYKCPEGVEEPGEIIEAVQQAFADDEVIYENTFMTKILNLKNDSENNEGYFFKANEYKSNGQYRSDLNKHRRMGRNPRDKYDKPLTSTQQIGWEKPVVREPIRGKKSCDETKYASAMVQASQY